MPLPSEIKTIAVLPFRIRGTAAGNEYLEFGLAESVAMKTGRHQFANCETHERSRRRASPVRR